MNLLLLDQFSDTGGAQLCLLDLLPAILSRGWRAVVAAPGNGVLFDRARSMGATVERISCGPYSSGRKAPSDFARFIRDWPRVTGQIRALIARYEIDLVHVNGPRLVPAAAWAARRRLPLVFHCHSLVPQPYRSLLLKPSLAWASATVVSSSQFTAGSPNVHVVRNGVADCARPRQPRRSGYHAGVVGRIAPQKGQMLFVQAARILLRTMPDCSFEICGSPLFGDPDAILYEQQLRRLAAGLPVRFTPWTDDVASVLARLDLLVVPSTAAEAIPRVIAEAFSAGVPVVAFASGGIPEVVFHGRTGFIAAEATSDALARAMLDAYFSDRLGEVVRAARSEWETHLTLDRYRNEMIDLLERAARRSDPAEKQPEQQSGHEGNTRDRSDHHRIAKA